MAEFEEEYLDILQNIEAAIISVYREHSQLTDYDVEKALNALIQEYQAEQTGQTALPVSLALLPRQIYDRTKAMCEWRLGREHLANSKGQAILLDATPPSVEEILACLKRIRKSVQKWNKRSGQRGYLQYVEQFIG
jgi:hypothetical protein